MSKQRSYDRDQDDQVRVGGDCVTKQGDRLVAAACKSLGHDAGANDRTDQKADQLSAMTRPPRAIQRPRLDLPSVQPMSLNVVSSASWPRNISHAKCGPLAHASLPCSLGVRCPAPWRDHIVDYLTCDDINNEPGAPIGKSRDLGHLSGFQPKQNGDSALGQHTNDAPSNCIRRFHSIPYGNVVLSGPCAVSDLDDPTESLVAHARLTSPTDRGIEATSAADRARTTPMITSLLEPECFRVAITAISVSAMATLKYCKDGATKNVRADPRSAVCPCGGGGRREG